MKTQKILAIIVLTMLSGCTKTAEELLVQSEKNMQESRIDLAIKDLQNLLKKHPTDSLASKAQYKLSSIYLNWKNDPEMGYEQLELTIKNYTESIHGKQASDQIKEFPEYLINKAESLRKQKLLKESVAHLMLMIDKYDQHTLSSKAQYMLGDLYMNDFRDFTTAIQEYRKVLEKHTGSDQEPHALFMIGYIYANIISDEKSAKVEYESFLTKFPTHELAPSVKFEIDYLGKSIDQIPALKHITS
tara:strand:+ start:377 stop:1111 length:735 start_codon:yes stop_codon:yes gene_type:complete